jgi:hypothetical protein
MYDLRFCPARPEETILVEDDNTLDHTQEHKQTRQNVQGVAGKRRVGGQVSPDSVDNQRRQGLVCTKEKFVRESAENRDRKESYAPQ